MLNVHLARQARRGAFAALAVAALAGATACGDDNNVTGQINQAVSTGGMQVFAGAREDPFFLDLEQFLRILPDRKPATGPLSQIPETQSATSFRAAGAAVDALKGSNLLSIVIELPTAQLTAGGNAKLGIWGTISR